MKKRIPEFKNEKEEALFWSKHSPIEFINEFKEDKAPFEFTVGLLKKVAEEHREKKGALTLRMEPSQIYLTKIIAKIKGDKYQTLMRRWIRERLYKEVRENPEIENEIRKQKVHLA
jgi:predicted DNA binding CopG/RHH family protein